MISLQFFFINNTQVTKDMWAVCIPYVRTSDNPAYLVVQHGGYPKHAGLSDFYCTINFQPISNTFLQNWAKQEKAHPSGPNRWHTAERGTILLVLTHKTYTNKCATRNYTNFHTNQKHHILSWVRYKIRRISHYSNGTWNCKLNILSVTRL